MPDVLPTINNEPPQGIQALLDTVYLWNPDVANDLIDKINELLARLNTLSGTIPPYSELVSPIQQYTPCYNGDNVYVAAQDMDTLPETFNPSQWILIATKAPVLQAGEGIDIEGNQISVSSSVLEGAAAGATAIQAGDLGSAAYANDTDFATAAQGQLADTAIQAEDLGTAAYAATTDFATAAQGALADTAIQSVKTINGTTITGTGDVQLSTYLTYPNGWPTTGTTLAFCNAIAEDTTAIEGKAYLGEVTLNDLPAGIANAEIEVKIMSGTTQSNKVVVLTLTSGNVSPYFWQYTYWNHGSNVSGWVTWLSSTTAIPSVINNYSSTSTTDALSANMGNDLNERLTSVEGRGRYLSTWNCTTGLAGTNPPTSPYVYKSGDYFIVSTVGATNYRPSGSQYVTGTASTVVETQSVAVNDTYQFDGTNWTLLKNTVEDPLPSQTGQSGNFLTTDGTNPAWAAISFPVTSVNTKTGAVTLSASDVGALPSGTHIPADQVNSDWNASSGVAEILNKPTLGTAAAASTTDFATAAQGALADTALQSGDNVSELVNNANYATVTFRTWGANE